VPTDENKLVTVPARNLPPPAARLGPELNPALPSEQDGFIGPPQRPRSAGERALECLYA
jgi:hypothetical protein